MLESTLPFEVWKHILCYCDYYTAYFSLYETCSFLHQLTLDCKQEHFQILFSNHFTMHIDNLSSQLVLYQQINPNKPWLKKLLYFYWKNEKLLPSELEPCLFLKDTNDNPLLLRIDALTVQRSTTQPEIVSVQSNGFYKLNSSILMHYFEVTNTGSTDIALGLSTLAYNPLLVVGSELASIGLFTDDKLGIGVVSINGNVEEEDVVFDKEKNSSTSTMGCGFIYHRQQYANYVFFTRGSHQILSKIFQIKMIPTQLLAPSVSLQHHGGVRMNFGQTPFQFTNWKGLLDRVVQQNATIIVEKQPK